MAPKQFPAFSGSSQTVFELGVSQTVSEFVQAAPRPFLNFLGRVQERGGQTQGVQRTAENRSKIVMGLGFRAEMINAKIWCPFGSFGPVSEPFRVASREKPKKKKEKQKKKKAIRLQCVKPGCSIRQKPLSTHGWEHAHGQGKVQRDMDG